MNWSQRLLVTKWVGGVGGALLIILGALVGSGFGGFLAFVGVLGVLCAIGAAIASKFVHSWHKAGSVGKGVRVWHE